MKLFRNSQKGFTMVELMAAVGLTGVVGMVLFGVIKYADKETKIVTEDIQTTILKFGATKVLQRDLSNAHQSFNYLEVNDDNNKPFLVLGSSEYCLANCSRQLTLTIPDGQVRSDKVLYLLVIKGLGGEMLRFSIDPNNTFDSSTKKYKYLNGRDSDPDYSISKNVRPYSPWTAGRILLLTSEMIFYDCLTGINGVTSSTCPLSLKNSSDENYAVQRPYKMLGVVNSDEKELEFFEVAMRPDLLRKEYKVCRADKNMGCSAGSVIDMTGGGSMKNAQTFFENMPILPGQDNSAYLQPIEFVRYHLERPTPHSKDSEILLMRSTASFNGSKLSFDRAHAVMNGVKSLVFTRKNISNSVIEFKIVEANIRARLK